MSERERERSQLVPATKACARARHPLGRLGPPSYTKDGFGRGAYKSRRLPPPSPFPLDLDQGRPKGGDDKRGDAWAQETRRCRNLEGSVRRDRRSCPPRAIRVRRRWIRIHTALSPLALARAPGGAQVRRPPGAHPPGRTHHAHPRRLLAPHPRRTRLSALGPARLVPGLVVTLGTRLRAGVAHAGPLLVERPLGASVPQLAHAGRLRPRPRGAVEPRRAGPAARRIRRPLGAEVPGTACPGPMPIGGPLGAVVPGAAWPGPRAPRRPLGTKVTPLACLCILCAIT